MARKTTYYPYNSYALLALFISPWKDKAALRGLAKHIQRSKIDWQRLFHLANLHFCAPLWYVRLKKDGLLPLLPVELQTYLEHLHQANTERQDALRQHAAEIVSCLQPLDVPVILLKGAAAFCDDLYEDPGARMMGDLDFLVPNQQIEVMNNLLLELGYEQQDDCFGNSAGFFESNAPHHLPRYLKPKTPVVVEAHFRTAQGQADRVLPTDLCWMSKEQIDWEGARPFLLTPTYRLLHNTVHALVSRRIYIDSSIISLGHLAEFAYLVHRYASKLDWREWLARGAAHGLGRHFRAYLTLAHRLMGVPYPVHVSRVLFPGLLVTRISGASANWADDLAGFETRRQSVRGRIRDVAVKVHVYMFRRLHRPSWDWHNMCYKEGLRNLPMRLLCLSVFACRRLNIKDSLDFRRLFGKLRKIVHMLRKPKSQ